MSPRKPLRLLAPLVIALPLMAPLACTPEGVPPKEPPPIEVSEHGVDRGEGNLLAVQAWMQPHDYASEETFFARLDELLDEASARGLLGPRTVVVLPEYVGAWLVAEGESEGTFGAETTSDAMSNIVFSHPFAWMGALFSSPAEDGVTYATFHAKGRRMAEVYQSVMSRLAKEHAVTLVGGSILLPEPSVKDGSIEVTEGGALYNASFVFGADGKLIGPAVLKSFPTADEQGFLAAGSPSELPVFDTPAGRLGVLVCADSWFPEAWSALEEGGAELVAVPVFVAGAGVWDEPWGGYSGHPAPDDVDTEDIGSLTEAEAWKKYALPGRLPSSGARAGVTAPLRGALWDLEGDGVALLSLPNGEAEDVPSYDGPALINLWL